MGKKQCTYLFALLVGTMAYTNAYAGNGAPNGPHFNLNILGKSKAKSASMDCGSGHRIFVALSGTTKILLAEGDFAVLDCNGTDGTARFQLPNPDADGDGITSYSVYIRPLGRPGGSASLRTCATDVATGEYLCSIDSVSVKRTNGKQSFSNVSRDLLYVNIDIDGDGDIDHIPLFDDRLEGYLWEYDNNGLKLLQMRFYEVATNTN